MSSTYPPSYGKHLRLLRTLSAKPARCSIALSDCGACFDRNVSRLAYIGQFNQAVTFTNSSFDSSCILLVSFECDLWTIEDFGMTAGKPFDSARTQSPHADSNLELPLYKSEHSGQRPQTQSAPLHAPSLSFSRHSYSTSRSTKIVQKLWVSFRWNDPSSFHSTSAAIYHRQIGATPGHFRGSESYRQQEVLFSVVRYLELKCKDPRPM